MQPRQKYCITDRDAFWVKHAIIMMQSLHLFTRVGLSLRRKNISFDSEPSRSVFSSLKGRRLVTRTRAEEEKNL